MKHAWRHFGTVGFTLAMPVTVLSMGDRRAHVKNLHRYRWNKKWRAAGSTLYVPSYLVTSVPLLGALVSIGSGSFVSSRDPMARKLIKRWRDAP